MGLRCVFFGRRTVENHDFVLVLLLLLLPSSNSLMLLLCLALLLLLLLLPPRLLLLPPLHLLLLLPLHLLLLLPLHCLTTLFDFLSCSSTSSPQPGAFECLRTRDSGYPRYARDVASNARQEQGWGYVVPSPPLERSEEPRGPPYHHGYAARRGSTCACQFSAQTNSGGPLARTGN